MNATVLASLTWVPVLRAGHEDIGRSATDDIRSALDRLGEWTPTEGLPGWTAAAAHGHAEPHLGIPESSTTAIPDHLIELVDALWALGRASVGPPVRAPLVEVGGGSLLATRAASFVPKAVILDPRTKRTVRHEGPSWGSRLQHRLPAATARVLQDFLLGPPAREPGETDPEWSDRRHLWWGQLSPRLRAQRVQIQGLLATTMVTAWDRLQPSVRFRAGGTAEVSLQTDPSGLRQPADVERALDQLRVRPGITPQLRVGRHTVHVSVSPRGRDGLKQLFQVREQLRADPNLSAVLRDAPGTVFDPDLFDLDGYSDRVVGIDLVPPVYRPRRASGREFWTFVAGDGSGHQRTFSPEQQAAIWAAIREAARNGKSYAFAEGCWFRVPPPEDLDGPPDPSAHAVQAELQVKQNIESLEHAPEDHGAGYLAEIPLPPPNLAGGIELFPHQREGVRWLAGHALWDDRASEHGMLADDMGLGKTLQVLCLMSLLQGKNALAPTLLVAPLSLLDNWEAEAQRFFPGRFPKPLRIGGPTGRRGATADLIRSQQWILASYEGLHRNQLELGKVRFSLMVLDESHRIRNPSAGVTRATLAMHADRRLALTGTPVQNRLADLWSQFDWLSPGWLGDLSTFDQKHAADGDEGALIRLRDTVGPRILRRMKRRVLADKLPPLHDDGPTYRPVLTMPKDQASLYDAVLRDKSADGKRGSFGLLHRLLQVCACPNMVADRPVSDPKFDWLMKLLKEVQAKGEKVLIFAEWYELQDHLIRAITKRFGVFVDRVNGQVVAGERLGRVNRFNAEKGFSVLVLGPKAAGVGLNITGANHVVHYTRHWNPAHEAQATDRAYRIGQTRPVHVYRPIVHHPTEKSLEVHLDALLRSKEALAEEVIVPTAMLGVGAELKKVVEGH